MLRVRYLKENNSLSCVATQTVVKSSITMGLQPRNQRGEIDGRPDEHRHSHPSYIKITKRTQEPHKLHSITAKNNHTSLNLAINSTISFSPRYTSLLKNNRIIEKCISKLTTGLFIMQIQERDDGRNLCRAEV